MQIKIQSFMRNFFLIFPGKIQNQRFSVGKRVKWPENRRVKWPENRLSI